jgi:hypothetical protein
MVDQIADVSRNISDKLEIRELLENWVIWRDSGDWARFATVWHEGGRMNATWFSAVAPEFIARSKKAFEAGMVGLHTLGGCTIDVSGDRAISQTKMEILQRAPLDGVPVDVFCKGRFVDAWERRDGRWGLVLRQPVYELDRLQPVDPSAEVALDPDLLAAFPEGYRHLAYLQTKLGFEVSKTLPGTRGVEIAALMDRLSRWLETGAQVELEA